MDFRHKDNSSRAMLEQPLIANNYAYKDSWSSLSQYLNDTLKNRVLDISKFEIVDKDGFVSNIVNRFFLSLDNPQYLVKIKFDHFQANEFSEKVKSIAKHIYGDTTFYYLIMYFNNIKHPSELSTNFLMNNGLVVLNSTGLDKLNEIIQFITSKSSSSEFGEGVLGL